MRKAADVTFNFDASPFGIGGILVRHGRPVSWFMDAITDFDIAHLGIARGEASGQQACEALSALVGMRVWKAWWCDRRCTMGFRGDNITALTMALTLKAPPGPVKQIAPELALDYADAAFEPEHAGHVPGISNILADLMSRRYDPAHAAGWQLPPILRDVPRVRVPIRDFTFWRLPA